MMLLLSYLFCTVSSHTAQIKKRNIALICCADIFHPSVLLCTVNSKNLQKQWTELYFPNVLLIWHSYSNLRHRGRWTMLRVKKAISRLGFNHTLKMLANGQTNSHWFEIATFQSVATLNFLNRNTDFIVDMWKYHLHKLNSYVLFCMWCSNHL